MPIQNIIEHENYILDSSVADEEELTKIEVACEAAVAKSVKFADESPFPDPSALTEDVYTSYKD